MERWLGCSQVIVLPVDFYVGPRSQQFAEEMGKSYENVILIRNLLFVKIQQRFMILLLFAVWWKFLVFLSFSFNHVILALCAYIVSSVIWICSNCSARWVRWFLSIAVRGWVSLMVWKIRIDEGSYRLLEITCEKLLVTPGFEKGSKGTKFQD